MQIYEDIYEGEVQSWNWIKDYGIATITSGPLPGNDVFIMASNCLEVKQEGAKNFEFDGRPVEHCCKGRVWFDLFETIYFTMEKDNPNVAVNISFTNDGHLTRLMAAGKPLPYSQAERKLLTLAGLVLPDRRAIVDTQAIVDIDDELDANQLHSPSYASDSTDDEEDNGRRVTEVQTPAKKSHRTPAKPPAKKQSKSPHVGIPPSPYS